MTISTINNQIPTTCLLKQAPVSEGRSGNRLCTRNLDPWVLFQTKANQKASEGTWYVRRVRRTLASTLAARELSPNLTRLAAPAENKKSSHTIAVRRGKALRLNACDACACGKARCQGQRPAWPALSHLVSAAFPGPGAYTWPRHAAYLARTWDRQGALGA